MEIEEQEEWLKSTWNSSQTASLQAALQAVEQENQQLKTRSKHIPINHVVNPQRVAVYNNLSPGNAINYDLAALQPDSIRQHPC